MSSFNNLNIGSANGAHFGDVNQTTNVTDSTVDSISQSAQQQTTIEHELQKLNAAVDELAKKLPPEQATQVKNDLATLTSEVKSPKPRRSMFDVSAQGLLDAAKFVAEMATPIGSAVLALTKLLF